MKYKNGNDIQWLLPTNESRNRNEEYIKHNAKYHCFVASKEKDNRYHRYGLSLCKRHTQLLDYYEEISSAEIESNPNVVCKVCLKKWLEGKEE